MKTYLDLDYKSGYLYEYRKTPVEGGGFEMHTSSSGNVSYRKYLKSGVVGRLSSVYLSEGNFGLQLMVAVENDNGKFIIKLQIFSNNGRMDSFVESLLDYLPNLEQGATYRFYPYVMETQNKSGKDVVRRGFSIKHAEVQPDGKVTLGEKVDRYLIFIGKDDVYDPNNPKHLPPLKFIKGLGGKLTPDAVSIAQRKQFYEDLLQKQVERLDANTGRDEPYTPNANPSPPNTAAKNPTSSTPTVSDDVPRAMGSKAQTPTKEPDPIPIINDGIDEMDDDDLPF